MGASVLSKDEKEQRTYIVLLIEVPLYGSSIFSVFTHVQTKACANTHTGTHAVTAIANRFAILSLLSAEDA